MATSNHHKQQLIHVVHWIEYHFSLDLSSSSSPSSIVNMCSKREPLGTLFDKACTVHTLQIFFFFFVFGKGNHTMKMNTANNFIYFIIKLIGFYIIIKKIAILMQDWIALCWINNEQNHWQSCNRIFDRILPGHPGFFFFLNPALFQPHVGRVLDQPVGPGQISKLYRKIPASTIKEEVLLKDFYIQP